MAREAGRPTPAVDGQGPSGQGPSGQGPSGPAASGGAPGAGRPPTPPTPLEELWSNPRSFSFVQAVRLMRNVQGGRSREEAEHFLLKRLRVRALLSLGFPATDMADLEVLPPEDGETDLDSSRIRITATFLGLYGPSSPLPTFYTEELLDEQAEDRSVSRDFLDVVGGGFFNLFFLAWTRYRLALKAYEERDPATLERLFSLVGLGDPEIRDVFKNPGRLLRAAGLLTQFPRSAAGLRGLVADRVGAPVRVVQCVRHNVPIPPDQRCALGAETASLGETAWLGSHVRDDTGKFRLEIGPMKVEAFRASTPGGSWHEGCLRLVRFYCTEPLEYDILFRLDPEDLEGARLGQGHWSRLGCDTWLGAEGLEDPRMLFTDARRHGERDQQRRTAQ